MGKRAKGFFVYLVAVFVVSVAYVLPFVLFCPHRYRTVVKSHLKTILVNSGYLANFAVVIPLFARHIVFNKHYLGIKFQLQGFVKRIHMLRKILTNLRLVK